MRAKTRRDPHERRLRAPRAAPEEHRRKDRRDAERVQGKREAGAQEGRGDAQRHRRDHDPQPAAVPRQLDRLEHVDRRHVRQGREADLVPRLLQEHVQRVDRAGVFFFFRGFRTFRRFLCF